MKCIYKTFGNICLKHSSEEALEHCLDGPCPDEILRGSFVYGKHDLRDKTRDWARYLTTLEACYGACLRAVIEYQEELIPGYRERAERAERERDAAIEDCSGYCATCTFLFDCAKHDMNDAAQPRWYYGDCQDWEWRGIQEDKL